MTKGLPRSLSRGPLQLQPIVKQTIVVRDLALSVTATATAIGFGSAVLSGLPEGNILLLGAVSYLQFSGPGTSSDLTDTFAADYGIGTTPADDATITATDVDIIQSTAISPSNDEISALTKGTHATSGVLLDNTDGSLEINLTLLVDAADIVDDATVAFLVDGHITIAYIVLGDE
jgi:hypothetical protein